MTRHYDRELDKLLARLLEAAGMVRESLQDAIAAHKTRDAERARRPIAVEEAIDRIETEIEEDCLKLLALYQPMAVDLRFLVIVLKVNNDLEHISDIAAKIAKRARWLAKREPLPWPDELWALAEKVEAVFDDAMKSMAERDKERAIAVYAAEAEVDKLKRAVVRAIRQRIKEGQEDVMILLRMLETPRQLERVADLATKIAGDVVYLVTGEIQRHQHLDED